MRPPRPVEPGKGGGLPGLRLVKRAGVGAGSCRGALPVARALRTLVATRSDTQLWKSGLWGDSSRGRRAGRGFGGCRNAAAAPGPPPHDRSAASGSRARVMPFKLLPSQWKSSGIELRARDPRLLCCSKLASAVGSGLRSGTAHFLSSWACSGSRLPAEARSGGRSLSLEPFILGSLRLPRGFLPSSSPAPAQLFPPSEPSPSLGIRTHPFHKLPSPSLILDPNATGMNPLDSPLVNEIK